MMFVNSDSFRHWLAVGDETCSVESVGQTFVVDPDSMSERDAEWLETVGALPDNVVTYDLTWLLRDAFRYRAMLASTRFGVVECAGCRFTNDVSTPVDWVVAPMVEWDVMGHSASHVLLCPECSGTV